MATRLGNVLYWAACLLALGWILISYFGTASMKVPEWSTFWVAGMVPAVGIWLVGRAVRYVLSAV